MAFHEVRFPVDISYGSAGGPGYVTDIVVVDSGAEERVQRRTNAQRRYDVAYGVRSHDTLSQLVEFYIARAGAANGFRYWDPFDFTTADDHKSPSSSLDVVLGVGDGVTTTFQMKKYYASGVTVRTRVLEKIYEDTAAVAVDGVELDEADWSINENTGLITLNTAPATDAVVTGGCRFDVPVRFAKSIDDLLSLSYDDFGSGSAKSIELIELLGSNQNHEESYAGGSLTIDPMTADYTLSYSDGKAVVLNVTVASRSIILPDPADESRGGPHFVIINTGSESVDVEYPAATLVVTLAPGTGRHFYIALDGPDNAWYYA